MQKHNGELKHGFMYEGKLQRNFELQPIQSAGQLFDAEIEAGGVENQLAFNGALLAYQLVHIGDCKGPFGIAQIRAMHPDDFKILREAQNALLKQSNVQATDPNAGNGSGNTGNQ